ncbi:hypothetical protein AUJ14_05125 [Candidatus Micrarchaeota archaeon CG1_02_55_22]|nr:MAG: hypothetical protein AUJ14_05125 [Candidatus Micrarchaeota archaeon CG1_02_55_22]
MASKERRVPLTWVNPGVKYFPEAPLDHPNTIMAHEVGHALHLYQPGIHGLDRPVEKKVHEFVATMSALEYLKRHRPQDFKSFMSRTPTSFEHRMAKKVMAALPRAEARNKFMRAFFKDGVFTEARLTGWLIQHKVNPYEFDPSKYREPDYF